MKRIINGVTYNTDTATLIAEGSFDDNGDGSTSTDGALYQNRAGVYFHVDTLTTAYRDRHGEVRNRVAYEWFEVGDAAKARDWCEKHELTIIRDIEDMPPEAVPGERMATLYIRVPPALKSAIEAKANDDEVSVNVTVMRCLEGCMSLDDLKCKAMSEIFVADRYLEHLEQSNDDTLLRDLLPLILQARADLHEAVETLGVADDNLRERALDACNDTMRFSRDRLS